MCGRMVLTRSALEIAEFFELETELEWEASYNVAPNRALPVVRAERPGARSLAMLHWGLVPFWARQVSIGQRLINARSETAASKPSFRAAMRRRRCIVPADAFYEWGVGSGRKRRPHLFRRRGGEPLAIAGLWERWQAADSAQPLESCVLLTREADATVRPVHERMPVLLARESFDRWLDPECVDPERIADLLEAAPDADLERFAVGRWVNDPGHDDPRCIEPEEGIE